MSDAAKSAEVPLTPAAAQPSSIQIPVDASKMQSVYANFFRLSLSSSMEEVLVDIGLHTGIMQSQNLPTRPLNPDQPGEREFPRSGILTGVLARLFGCALDIEQVINDLEHEAQSF